MKALVTGASGFLGGNLARVLSDRGREVRVLIRENSDRRAIEGLDVEIAYGDVTDPAACLEAARGCDEVYHCAALYKLFVRDRKEMHRANVEGTVNVLRAAGEAGVKRIVYTSTVGALGNPGDGTMADEQTPVDYSEMVGPYKQSKFLAEQEALRLVREENFPIIIVNPTAPVGPRDVKPTPTGQMIVNFLAGKMPAYLDTGLNIIDVEDCATGHVLAAENGRIGEKYVLGGENLTLETIFRMLGELARREPPKVKLPHGPVLALAYVTEAIARTTGFPREPQLNVPAVKMAKKKMWFSSEKAHRELGLQTRAPREALRRAIQWFEENNYVDRAR